jgi:hypothetical protein
MRVLLVYSYHCHVGVVVCSGCRHGKYTTRSDRSPCSRCNTKRQHRERKHRSHHSRPQHGLQCGCTAALVLHVRTWRVGPTDSQVHSDAAWRPRWYWWSSNKNNKKWATPRAAAASGGPHGLRAPKTSPATVTTVEEFLADHILGHGHVLDTQNKLISDAI